MGASEAHGAGRHATAAGKRPGHRLSRAVRRVGWLVGAAMAVLMGGGFSWTLARASVAPSQAAALPAAERQLVQQSATISRRVAQDQQQVNALEAQVAQLTGSGSGSVPSGGAVPRTHAFTGAS